MRIKQISFRSLRKAAYFLWLIVLLLPVSLKLAVPQGFMPSLYSQGDEVRLSMVVCPHAQGGHLAKATPEEKGSREREASDHKSKSAFCLSQNFSWRTFPQSIDIITDEPKIATPVPFFNVSQAAVFFSLARYFTPPNRAPPFSS